MNFTPLLDSPLDAETLETVFIILAICGMVLVYLVLKSGKRNGRDK